jgi:hypothetical protein
VLEAVPELADQVEPLVDREPSDLVAGELHAGMLAPYLGLARPLMGEDSPSVEPRPHILAPPVMAGPPDRSARSPSGVRSNPSAAAPFCSGRLLKAR